VHCLSSVSSAITSLVSAGHEEQKPNLQDLTIITLRSACCLIFVDFLLGLLFLTLTMEAIYSSQTSIHFHHTTRRYVPDDNTLHMQLRSSLKTRNHNSFQYETTVNNFVLYILAFGVLVRKGGDHSSRKIEQQTSLGFIFF
jgi:hypothetical protein